MWSFVYIFQLWTYRVSQKKPSFVFKGFYLEALKNELQIKVGEFWKIQEISSLLSTKILYFYPKMPEI